MVSTPANHVWVLDLVRAEFSSALHRRRRNNEIDDAQLEMALIGFEEQLRLFHVQPLGPIVLDEAVALLARFGRIQGLRTLDALQLGAYSLVLRKDWVFVCADKNLASVAEHVGYKVIDPTENE